MNTIRLFNYPGTKRSLTESVNKILQNWRHPSPFWVEPFCGSASLYYNIACDLSGAHLNDLDPNVTLMHKACRHFDYRDYQAAVEDVDMRFGDCKADKDAYYAFRKWWNETGSKTPESGLYLIYLSSMCINSMLRFGPNGMNQGWGARKSVIEQSDWDEMHRRLQRAQITSSDFREVEIKDGSVVFLDPPYEAQAIDTYARGFQLDGFLSWLGEQKAAHKDCLWLYTDAMNSKSDSLLQVGFKRVTLRDMKTISPLKAKDKVTSTEVMYVGLS